MSRHPEWSFDDWTDYLTDTVEKKVIKHNDDQVCLCCGDEGTGKSIFSLASKCEVERKRGLEPRSDTVYYEWEEYRDTNLSAMLAEAKNYPKPLITRIMKEYELDPKELKTVKGSKVTAGDILQFDEAGTQVFNRDAMTSKNIELTKLMICNRYLNLFHILNVPKPGSMDKYIREERTRMLIWCDAEYFNNWETRLRRVFIYSKSSYKRIINSYRWWENFSNTNLLIKKFPPDAEVILPPDLPDIIPAPIHEYYLAKKSVFNIKQTYDMVTKSKQAVDREKKKDEGVNRDYSELMAKKGEKVEDWVSRTNLNPLYFTNYGGKRRK